MSVVNFLGWLQDSYPIAQLRAANHLVIEVTEVLHVLGLVTFLAALLLVNLRLLNIGLRRQSSPLVASAAAPLVWGGLTLTVLTGTILFLSGPVRYFCNSAFVPKMVLLALALLVQFTLYRKVTRTERPKPLFAGASAVLSLSLWFSVGLFGRAIGYV
ncbi:DUF6644 family protein [Duganella sp.]|uniref:DUF6644 family protein n=1 Tax=Duganella sp. TaxID=1904440 RepID=UPI0031E43C9A